MKQKYSAWFLAGLLLAVLPSAAAQAEISELLQGLPSKYCSAEDGRRPVVKSQGGYGTCWALAATSALEASLLPKTHVIFSADHMALNNAFSVTLNDSGLLVRYLVHADIFGKPFLRKKRYYRYYNRNYARNKRYYNKYFHIPCSF